MTLRGCSLAGTCLAGQDPHGGMTPHAKRVPRLTTNRRITCWRAEYYNCTPYTSFVQDILEGVLESSQVSVASRLVMLHGRSRRFASTLRILRLPKDALMYRSRACSSNYESSVAAASHNMSAILNMCDGARSQMACSQSPVLDQQQLELQ